MTKAMADAGADAVMVVTPCYFKSLMNNQALEQHYLKVNKYKIKLTLRIIHKTTYVLGLLPFSFRKTSESNYPLNLYLRTYDINNSVQ